MTCNVYVTMKCYCGEFVKLSKLFFFISYPVFVNQEVILPKTEPAPLMELGEQPPDLLRDMPSTDCLSVPDALGKHPFLSNPQASTRL